MNKFDYLYMDIALRVSEMSYSNRSKVGCVIVKDNNIVAFGWNGTPNGFDNRCEDENYNTIDEVIHSEENAICKAARQGISLNDSTIYLTLSPCPNCAKLIIQSGIKRVVYYEEYRINKSIEFLKKCNIDVEKY
jgi:dCMP deaminase